MAFRAARSHLSRACLSLELLATAMSASCTPRGCLSSGGGADGSAGESPEQDDASTPASRRAERATRREARARQAQATSASATGEADGSTAPAPPTSLTSSPDAGVYTTGDTAYREADCDTLGNVAPIEGAYVPGGTRVAVEAIARVRYPMGLPFLQVQDDAQLKTWFRGAPDTFEGVSSRFDAAVHEGSHVWGFKRFNPRTVFYPVRDDLTIETRRLTNFNRAEIVTRHVDPTGDSYAKIYLEGQSGAQGFNTLLDEYNAYAHSLASRYCTRDLLRPNVRVSAADGILTMMYYVETYLEIARTAHRADYIAILADAGHRRMILTVWDRAELWLRRSVGFRALGIDVERLTARVYEPTRLAEIGAVREAARAKGESFSDRDR